MDEDGRPPHDENETRRRLDGYLAAYPGLRGRVCRILLLHLHTEGRVRIEDVYRRAQRGEKWNTPTDPNVPSSKLWAADEKELINQIVVKLAVQHLAPDRVDEIVWAAHRRDEAQSLETLARMPGVPLELVAEKVSQYASLPRAAGIDRDTPVGTKVALMRRIISHRVEYIRIAKHHLRIQDLDWVLRRCVATDHGQGVVGGKAAGMVLAAAILDPCDACGSVDLPETAFVLTDVYDEFKQVNGLSHLEDHKYKEMEDVRANFRAIREIFRNAEFPARTADLLRIELNRWGEVPLIVRSSSVLEDNLVASFSGIYRSFFLLNQGPLEERLEALLGAIAEIYAGVFSPDAVSYRRRRNLLDEDERMGVMIQPVLGQHRGQYYMPDMAGVAFSRNDYRWNQRIRREDGLLRLVLGLGTRAVDRVGDYARMVPLDLPTMRPEGTPEEVMAASQKFVDVVDLRGGGFGRIPVAEALEAMRSDGIADYVSVYESGRLAVPVGSQVLTNAGSLCVTFDRLLARGQFTAQVTAMIKRLEEAYGTPVDVEFAVNEGQFYMLQCRPLGGEGSLLPAEIPENVPIPDRIFSAHRYVNSGELEKVDYVVLIDPRDYDKLDTIELRAEVAHVVGRLNDALAKHCFILMGPGRWGSRDIRLGIQVGYADISNASALVEIARTEDGYTPEPSFGTHFFQDLVEAGISYLPLYPDDPGAVFNEKFLRGSPNALLELSPGDAAFADTVQVVAVAQAAPGRSLRLAMDGEHNEALCYLES